MKVHNNKTAWKRCGVYPRMVTPALLSLVFLCVLCASVVSPASAQTTITGTVKDASGTALASGTIIFTLSQEGTVSDPALLVVQPVVTCSIVSGLLQAPCSLRGNDEISPAGTFYRLRIISTGGRTFLPERTYTITGATWDIGTATPLASDTIAAQAYQIVQDEGANLTQRQKLNFTGTGITCTDDSTNARTTCDLAAASGGYNEVQEEGVPLTARAKINFIGAQVTATDDVANGRTNITITSSGGGATHQIDGVALTAQDPINFLDTSEFDWTNPAVGDLSLALKAASVADSKLTSNYSGVGSCTNQFVRATVDNAGPTCESIADADLPSTNALDSEITLPNLGGGASGANTYDFGGATALEVPNSTTLPGTCTVGEVFHDTDAAVGARFYLCTALNTWTAFDNPFGTAVDIGEVSFDPILETELDTIAELNTQIADATIEVQGNKNAASGYAGLTAGTKLQLAQGQEVWAIADLSDVTAKSGNTTVVGTTSGALGAGNCAEFDASGNIVDSGAGCGGGAGDNISVNGTAAVDADFDDATPAAPGDGVNVRWQKDALTPNNISANLPFATGSAAGAVSTAAQTFAGQKTFTGGAIFRDNNTEFQDDADNTKVLQFQLSSITTGTTRTVTVPDANGEMSLLGQTIEDGELATDFISEIELDTEAELEAQLTDVTDVLTDAAGSCTNQVVTAVNDGAAPTCANVTSAMISDGVVASVDLAAANKQFTVSFVLESPVAADDALLQHKFSQAVTIQRISCSTDTGTVTIQFDERAEATPNTAGTDVMTSTLVCDNNTQATTTFSNAGIAADVPLNLDIEAVASSPGVVRIHIDYQIDN